MKNPILRRGLYILAGLVMFVLNVNYASAQILPECTKTGRCTLCDMVQTGINIGVFVLGIIGAVTFMIIVYGGLMMLISGGRSDYIKKGKDVLINAVVGLAIALLAYGVVNTVVAVVTEGGWSWEPNLKCAELPSPTQYTAPEYGSFLPGSDSQGNQPTSDKDEKITPNPNGWEDGTACEDKTQCKSGFCYEFSEIAGLPDATTIKAADNGKGICKPVSSIQENTVCEDANIDKGGGDDDIPCPSGFSCKNPGGGTLGTCKSSALGTDCYDKGQCSSGICHDFFDNSGTPDKDDEHGKCISLPLKQGDICEDANVDAGGADDDIACPSNMACKDKGSNSFGRCWPKDNGSICFDKAECSSGVCWEFGDPPSINWAGPGSVVLDAPNDKDDEIGICVQLPLALHQKCEDANIDRNQLDDDITQCGPGNHCSDTGILTLIGTCEPISP